MNTIIKQPQLERQEVINPLQAKFLLYPAALGDSVVNLLASAEKNISIEQETSNKKSIEIYTSNGYLVEQVNSPFFHIDLYKDHNFRETVRRRINAANDRILGNQGTLRITYQMSSVAIKDLIQQAKRRHINQ